MGSATVIHYGEDDCSRVPALKNAGYEVLVSDSLDRLKLDLERGEVDAVIVSGLQPRCTKKAAVLVRRRCSAPLILFRGTDVKHDVNRFDRVFSSQVPEAHWLFDTAVLVMQCKELRGQAETLREDCARGLHSHSHPGKRAPGSEQAAAEARG
jgi:hypothetical protein